MSDSLTQWSFMALVLAAFFLASAGASSAYLTVSEVFPMETRALAIALFYAVGTAVGGIAGPLLFGHFIHSGDADQVATGFFIGAGAMALGGIAELFFGVRAERQSLENIAKPLTAEEAEARGAGARAGRRPSRRAGASGSARARSVAERERAGLRRLRPGPGSGSSYYSPGMAGTAGTASRYAAMADQDLDREIESIGRALEEHGTPSRAELERSWAAGDGARGASVPLCATPSRRVARAARRAPATAPRGPSNPSPIETLRRAAELRAVEMRPHRPTHDFGHLGRATSTTISRAAPKALRPDNCAPPFGCDGRLDRQLPAADHRCTWQQRTRTTRTCRRHSGAARGTRLSSGSAAGRPTTH